MRETFRWDMLIVLLLFGFFACHLYMDRVTQEESYRRDHIDHLQMQYNTIIKAQTTLADALFATWINNEEIRSIIARVPAADERERERLRKELYRKLAPLYEQLQSYGIRQFHFHTPDNHSFLRFHKPERYGDDLSKVRHSVVKTNKELTVTRGFEEGRIFNGFRNVYPLFEQGKHIGSVEISFSFANIRDYLSDIFPATYDFIIKRKIAEADLFDAERENYTRCDICSDYVYDRAVLASNPPARLFHDQQEAIKQQVSEEVRRHVAEERSFSLSPKINDTYYALTFLSVKDLQNRHVAYIISLHEDPMLYELELSFNKSMLLVLIFALLFSALFYLLHLRKRHSSMIQRANMDYLTQSYNRKNCHQHIIKLIRSQRKNPKPCSLLLLDVDHFKRVNDTYGHDAGDRVLIEIVSLLQNSVRSSDIICRWGGEEFIVIVDTNLHTAESIAEKIRAKIAESAFEKVGHITVSIGITEIEPDDTEEQCFKRADMALYRAKERGRDRCVTYQ